MPLGAEMIQLGNDSAAKFMYRLSHLGIPPNNSLKIAAGQGAVGACGGGVDMARTRHDKADTAFGALSLIIDIAIVGQSVRRVEALGVGSLH